jgi:hypothetical protein
METDPISKVLCSIEYQTMDKVQDFNSLENKFLVIHPSFKNIAYKYSVCEMLYFKSPSVIDVKS